MKSIQSDITWEAHQPSSNIIIIFSEPVERANATTMMIVAMSLGSRERHGDRLGMIERCSHVSIIYNIHRLLNFVFSRSWFPTNIQTWITDSKEKAMPLPSQSHIEIGSRKRGNVDVDAPSAITTNHKISRQHNEVSLLLYIRILSIFIYCLTEPHD